MGPNMISIEENSADKYWVDMFVGLAINLQFDFFNGYRLKFQKRNIGYDVCSGVDSIDEFEACVSGWKFSIFPLLR